MASKLCSICFLDVDLKKICRIFGGNCFVLVSGTTPWSLSARRLNTLPTALFDTRGWVLPLLSTVTRSGKIWVLRCTMAEILCSPNSPRNNWWSSSFGHDVKNIKVQNLHPSVWWEQLVSQLGLHLPNLCSDCYEVWNQYDIYWA